MDLVETYQEQLRFVRKPLGRSLLIALLVVIQLWLVAAALDALVARQFGVLVPTAVASGVLFMLSGGLLWYVVSYDARLRQWGPRA